MKIGTRFGAALTAVVLAASMGLTALAASFTDVPENHAFYRTIEWCKNAGVMNGYSDGTFRPGDPLKVSHCLQTMFNAAKAADSSVEARYASITSPWYGAASAWYKDVAGMDYGNIAENPMNRAAMAIMTYYRWRGNSRAVAATGTLPFSDCTGCTELERTAIEFCWRNNIVDGYGDGTFRPYNNLTRGHMSKFAKNMSEQFSSGTAAPSATSGNGTGTAVPSATQNTTPSTTPAPSSGSSSGTPAPASSTSGTGTNNGNTPAAPTQSGGGSTSNPPAAPAAQPLTAAQAVTLAESLGLTVESFQWPNDSSLTGIRVYSAYNADGYTAYTFAVNADGSQWWTQAGSMGAMTPDAFRSWLQNLAGQLSNSAKTEIAAYYLAGYAVQQGLYAICDNRTVTVQTSASGTSSCTINNGTVSGGLAAAQSAIRSAATTLGNSRAEVAAKAIAAYAQGRGWNANASAYNTSEGTWHALCTKSATSGGTTTTTTFDIVVSVGGNGLGTWVPNGGTLTEYPLAGTLEALG